MSLCRPIFLEKKRFPEAKITELNKNRRKEICKFFRGGQGCKRRTCLYQHPSLHCKHYLKPHHCKHGQKCHFMHSTDIPLYHEDTVDLINDPRVHPDIRHEMDSALDAY